ncbi:MAG: thermonuclease family protein [Enhydrobacter sp.]|nr:MAG: thermonuclease family protein [Enhydrobacter sp.]
MLFLRETNRLCSAALLAATLTVVGPVNAQSVLDGDTISVEGRIWRLWGIEAPGTTQLCGDGWAAGDRAIAFLQSLVHDRVIGCEFRGRDGTDVAIGLCRADETDLGAAMVMAGMAWALTPDSVDYVPQEAEANARGLGVHAHDCLPPWSERTDNER